MQVINFELRFYLSLLCFMQSFHFKSVKVGVIKEIKNWFFLEHTPLGSSMTIIELDGLM